MIESNGQKYYEFADFRLVPGEGLLLHKGEPIPLSPKVFETLLYLIECRGHLVQRADLLEKVWTDSFVEENAVSKSVWSIRNTLQIDPAYPQFIQTVPKRGYRFVADVKEVSSTSNGGSEAAQPIDDPVAQPEAGKATTLTGNRTWIAGLALFGIVGLVFVLVSRGWLPGLGSSPQIRSLSVLTLTNDSGDPSEEYLLRGITETLTADLARIRELNVIALPADLRSPGGRQDLTAIGRRLGVEALVTGSMFRSGDRIRIAVQLVQTSTGRNLWAKTYERDARDIQSLEKEVARNIADRVRITISPQELERLRGGREADPEAYEYYLRGRFYLNLQNREDQDTAIAAIERAVEIDPKFATAWAELAQAYTWKHFSFAPKQRELLEKAFIAQEKALALDPNLPMAYLARGRVLWTPENKFPHEKAIRDYRRALELDPNLDEARNQLALVYYHIGELDRGLEEAKEGVRANPTNNLLQLRIGQILNAQGKYDAALSVLLAIRGGVHPSVLGHQVLWSLLNLGRIEESSAKLDELIREQPDDGGTFASFKAVLAALSGHKQRAEKLIADAIENGRGFGHFHHTAYTIACAYAIMNKPDESISWLEEAADTGFPSIPTFQKEPSLSNVRSDPRFLKLIERLEKKHQTYLAEM